MRLLLAVSLVSACVLPLSARADQNDLSIYQLGNPSTDPNAQSRFRMLGNELGISLSGATLEPPVTVGADGFSFTFEYTFAFVNGGAEIGGQPYWVTQSANPSLLMLPALHFRKGLPYSIEFGGKVETITNSSMFAGTVEARWGIVEGFRYLPDLAVRFAMTRLFGQPDMDLTTGEVSGSLGKEFGVGGTVTLTPYAGYGLMGIDSSSRVLLANQATETQQQYTSQPTAGQMLFTENTVGNNLYNRFYFGLRLRSNIVSLTVEYSYVWAETAGMPVNDPLQQLSASAGLTF